MSKAKKIISMLLVVAMVLTVAPVSVLASAADPNYTYGDVSFSNTEFSVDTTATTDVIRVAYAVGSFSLPAPGTAGQIVAATPSGIPKADTGAYINVAYAKETPAYPQISFSITGVTLDAVPTISATGINSPTISHNDGSPSTSGSTKTYTWSITNGTATAGSNAVFEITYKIKGVSYKAYAFSHVEHILVMGGWVGHLTRTSGTKAAYRHAIIFQVQSKNMYTDRNTVGSGDSLYYSGMNNPGTNSNAIGFINYATDQPANSGALLGCGNEDNLSNSATAYAVSAPHGELAGTEVGAFIKFRKEQSGGRYNGCLSNDGHMSRPIVYIDRRNEDLRSLNMRATMQYGEADKFSDFRLVEMTFHNYAFTFGSDAYDFTSSAPASEFSAVNYTSGSTGSDTVTTSNGNGAYVMVPITGTGPSASTGPYAIVADIYANNSNTFLAGGFYVDFGVYDTTVLWNIYNGVLNGESLSGTSTYVTPSTWTAAPSYTCTFNKGAHPQASMYTSGWDNFLAKLKVAGSILAKPDTNQTEIDNAAVDLYVAYDALAGYTSTVNWEINHYLEGTTTKIIPTQTVDPVSPVYGQSQPAGSTWLAYCATIDGYELSTQSSESQNMTLSGKNATETFNFYYKAKQYNLVVDPNTDETDEDNQVTLTSAGSKVYEDSLDYGTKEFYSFKGWYYDNGKWSQPVFSDSVSEGGMRYFTMPAKPTTIYAKWEATPIDIEYIPIADGNELSHVFVDGDEAEFDGGTTTQIVRPADLSIDGYLFVNYYLDAELTTAANFPIEATLGVTENPFKLYVRVVDVNGKISFESNGGTSVADKYFTAGQTVDAPEAPTKKGYTFAGWYTKGTADSGVIPSTPEYFADGTQKMDSSTGFIAYAMWAPNIYEISFDLGTPTSKFDTESLPGMTGYADSAIDPDDIPAAPKKFGYVFHHWELNGERYDFKKYPTENITLTPHWVESDYSAFIDITAYEKLSGNYVETSTAQTEDVITFRMTSQTNFYTGSSVFVFMYDKDFFELVDTGNNAFVLNDGSEYISGIDATHLGVTDDASLPWPDSLRAARNDYQAMMIAIDPQVTADNYSTAPMNDGEWIVEFQLRVKSTATGTGKVYMSNDWTRTADNIMGTMFYGWSKNESDVFNTFNNVVTPDLDQAFAEVTIEEAVTPDTKVTLYPNGGAYADAAEYKEYTGRAETEILDYVAPTREGYSLVGWVNRADSSEVTWTDEFYYPPETTPEAIYDAKWEANKYTVTFYTDDTLANVYYKLDYTYDSEVSGPPTAPTKTGYTFRAWVNAETGEDTTLPFICKGEAKFYPGYDPATNTAYTIRINYAATKRDVSKTGTTGYTVAIVENAGSDANTHYITLAELPTINGYEFDSANNTLPITGVIAADGSTIIEVNYKASIVTDTLDANGGTFADGSSTATVSGEFQTVIEEADLPAAPTKPGYKFLGYQGLTVGTTKHIGGRTYRANWEAIKYTMTFNAGLGAYADGSNAKTAEVAMGGAIAAPEVPTLLGYTFKGWSLNGGDATTTLGVLDAAEARTYTAVFEKTPYNVNYYVDGLLDADRSEVKYIGDSVVIASEPTKYGYTFGGWKLGDGSDAADFTITAEGDIDIYGEFTAKVLDVTFDANGGSWTVDDATVETQVVPTTFDTTIVAPASNPTRAGYEFVGWAASEADAEAKNTVTSFPALTTEDAVTYYAAWNATIWDYTIEFYYQDVNGNYGAAESGETLTYQGQVESTVSYNPDATKTGFTLDTANSVLEGTVSVETPLVLVVKYARNQHTLNIVVDEQTTTSQVYYGADVNVPADPEKAGYSFDGWSGYTEGMTMPDTDLTITATWTANQYTVTYYMDDTKTDVAYTRTAAYGSDYNVPAPTKEGHDFAAWMNADGTAANLPANGETTQIPLDGAEYYATWTVKSYTLNYRAGAGASFPDDSTAVKTYSIPYGTAQADWDKPVDPVLPGSTFNGWNMPANYPTMPATVVNVTANWITEHYNVIFKDSLSDEIYSEENLSYGNMVSIPEPEKEGYEFLYWMDEEGNEVTPMDTMEDIGADGATVTYTAKWNALPFTITFVDTGDVAYEAITKNFGEAVGTVADPVKTGYTFKGWDKEIPATMPAEDMTITAKWAVNQYTITFVDTGDVAYEAITKDYKAAVGTVADPVKTGYTFKGWDKDIPETMPAEDMTITAQWEINQYVITFADTGDTPIAPITQNYGTVITAPAAPTKTGYTFKGWDKEIPATMPAGDMTITAQWEIKQYTISFVDTGDVAYEAITKNYGEAIGTVADPVKTGYRFVSWDKEIPATMPAEDTVITAVWAINEYSIVFDMDGGDAIAPIVQNFGTDIDASAIVPSKTGYVFTGWVDANGNAAEIPATMPAENLTLKATWELDQFTFTFVVYGGSEVAPLTKDYTSAIDADALTTEKEGYSFIGWALNENPAEADKVELPATMPAEDRTYYAIWKINVYTVTFLDAEGEEFYSTELEYNETIEAPTGTPEKTHYTFVGWSLTAIDLGTADTPVDTTKLIDFVNAAPTVIADDMTIYPAFNRVVVTLKLVAGSTAVVETDRAADPVTGYIYGLKQKLKVATLTSEYLAVEGDGRLEVTPTKYGRCGTGTKVEVIDNVENEVVEVYYIIIFGDVNGDSAVDAADISAIKAEDAGITNWSKALNVDEYDYCKVLAADLTGMNDLDGDDIDDDGHVGDGLVTVNDATELNLVVLGYKKLDQTSGVTASI